MTSFIIEMAVTACLISNPVDCITLHTPTLFASPVQCQIMGQQALVEIMQPYPKRRVTRYTCDLVSGENT